MGLLFPDSTLVFDPNQTSGLTSTNNTSSPTTSGNINDYNIQTYGPSLVDGSGGGSTYQEPTYDPYAQYGGQTAYNNLVSGFNTQKQGILDSANQWGDNSAYGYQRSAEEGIRNLQQGQSAIDRKSTQNEASKISAGRGILDMVGRNIRSSGVMLGNRNAGRSSAAGRLAQLYGQQGRNQMSNVGNQYSSNAADIALDQDAQNWNQSKAYGDYRNKLMQDVNGTVESAKQQLTALDAQMANASLPDRIAIQQEADAIRSGIMGKLQQYDTQFQTGVSGIRAAGRNTNITNANSQLAAGQADPNLFNYEDQGPTSIQSVGGNSDSLPIYLRNKKRLT